MGTKLHKLTFAVHGSAGYVLLFYPAFLLSYALSKKHNDMDFLLRCQ